MSGMGVTATVRVEPDVCLLSPPGHASDHRLPGQWVIPFVTWKKPVLRLAADQRLGRLPRFMYEVTQLFPWFVVASGGNETIRPDVVRTTARVICPYGRPDHPVAIFLGPTSSHMKVKASQSLWAAQTTSRTFLRLHSLFVFEFFKFLS